MTEYVKPWKRQPGELGYVEELFLEETEFGKDRWVENDADSQIIPLYHWAPADRRKSILRHGLVPGKRTTTSVGIGQLAKWRPPYVCFAETPAWGWMLSGAHRPNVETWDLWQTYSTAVPGYLYLAYHGAKRAGQSHEIRVFDRIPKSKVWYVATRVGHPKTYRGTPPSVLG